MMWLIVAILTGFGIYWPGAIDRFDGWIDPRVLLPMVFLAGLLLLYLASGYCRENEMTKDFKMHHYPKSARWIEASCSCEDAFFSSASITYLLASRRTFLSRISFSCSRRSISEINSSKRFESCSSATFHAEPHPKLSLFTFHFALRRSLATAQSKLWDAIVSTFRCK